MTGATPEAMFLGYSIYKELGLTTRTILSIHEALIKGSSGYRKQQNAIMNDRTGEKVYTPPLAIEISNHIGKWENFVNIEDKKDLDPLIRCAIAHYQFEAIHPFGDGNGRTGRILLALQLVSEKLLTHPVLYMSGYLNRNREDYYKTLMGVTEKQDWERFVIFMLRGFALQAKKTKTKLFQMMIEYEKAIKLIEENHPKINAHATVEHLFTWPVTNPTKFSEALGMHYQTAGKHLNALKNSGLLRDTYIGKNHMYYNVPLLKMISH